MIEMLIACALVLVPLFLALPIIAKYQDIKAYTLQAARYAAWERTVWFGGAAAEPMGIGSSSAFSNTWDANEKTDAQIRAEIGTRLLSNGKSGFKDTDKSDSTFNGGPRALWRDRRGTPLLQQYNDVAVGYTNDVAPGVVNDLLTPVVNITSVVSNFTVDTKARYTSNVGFAVQRVAFNPDAGLRPCAGCPVDYLATGNTFNFTARNVIVANGWSANGPGSLASYGTHPEKITVYNQVRGLTPSSLLKPASGAFKTVLDVLNAIALVIFPELSTLDLGRIEVDKVPTDRLQ
jgi:hypothetical protein